MKNFIILLLLCIVGGSAHAQIKNSITEVKDYREADGKIILELMVNGTPADFVLDLGGGNAVLPEFAEKLNLPAPEKAHSIKAFLFKEVAVVTGEQREIESISFGNSAYGNNFPVLLLEDAAYLRKLGVAGVVNGKIFSNVCLTIDSRRKKITMTAPYRPAYMKLENRVKFMFVPFGCGLVYTAELDGMAFPLYFDTWSDEMVMLTPEDFARLPGKTGKTSTAVGYAEKKADAASKEVNSLVFAKQELGEVTAAENKALKKSMLGGGLLKRGIVSVDMRKGMVYFQDFDEVPVVDDTAKEEIIVVPGKLNEINRDYFIEHVYDYKTDKDFTFKGDKPVVVDFWATWCGPCMRMMPEMEGLAEKYKDSVIFLKVNADREKELCSLFRVTAIPAFLFIPLDGEPVMEVGDRLEKIEQIILEKLLKK